MIIDLKYRIKDEIELLNEQIICKRRQIEKILIDYIKDPLRCNSYSLIEQLKDEINDLQYQENNLKNFLENFNGKYELDENS